MKQPGHAVPRLLLIGPSIASFCLSDGYFGHTLWRGGRLYASYQWAPPDVIIRQPFVRTIPPPEAQKSYIRIRYVWMEWDWDGMKRGGRHAADKQEIK